MDLKISMCVWTFAVDLKCIKVVSIQVSHIYTMSKYTMLLKNSYGLDSKLENNLVKLIRQNIRPANSIWVGFYITASKTRRLPTFCDDLKKLTMLKSRVCRFCRQWWYIRKYSWFLRTAKRCFLYLSSIVLLVSPICTASQS